MNNENPEQNASPKADTPIFSERRSEDRRMGDRRKSNDRRVGDRRKGEAHGRGWKGRKYIVSRTTKVLVVVLALCVVALLIDRALLTNRPQIEGPLVKVKVSNSSEWICAPRDLAYHFATEDVIRRVEQNPKNVFPAKVRNDMIRVQMQTLLTNEEMLLQRVATMSWDSFASLASQVRKGKADATMRDYEDALAKASVQ